MGSLSSEGVAVAMLVLLAMAAKYIRSGVLTGLNRRGRAIGMLLAAAGPGWLLATMAMRFPAWLGVLCLAPIIIATTMGLRIRLVPGVIDRRDALLADWIWLNGRRHQQVYSADEVAEIAKVLRGLDRFRGPETSELIDLTQAEFNDWLDDRVVDDPTRAVRDARLRILANDLWPPRNRNA